jgi:serine/threonine protein kinase
MGDVYLGETPGGGKVAVKVIRRELASDPHFRARFTREVAAAKTINGLYTAHVVNADTDAPEPWLATAYIPGPSLGEAVRDQGPMPPAEVSRLAAALAEGLSQIHAAGLVHRDLKPSNVLLDGDWPRIIDFGIAWSLDATTLTPQHGAIGSPGYMSPEQAREGEIGPASDVFSLGSVLYYAATGKPPFGLGGMAALVYRTVHDEPDMGLLPAEIRPIVSACMAKDPARRPAPEAIVARLGRQTRATPQPAPRPEPVTTPEPEPERVRAGSLKPAPGRASSSGMSLGTAPARLPGLVSPPQPVEPVRSPQRVSNTEPRPVRGQNPAPSKPSTPTDVKIVVASLTFMITLAAITIGVTAANLFHTVTAAVYVALFVAFVAFTALTGFIWFTRSR